MSFNGQFSTPLRPKRTVTATGLGGVIGLAAILFGVACLNGWLLMVAVGIAASHQVVGGTLPFWDSVALAFLLTTVFATSANTKVGRG